MAYAASIDCLLYALYESAPAKVDALAREKRRVCHGLLSVGLKLHCLGGQHLFAPLIDALGGETRVLNQNMYRSSRAAFCMVLPPVGSARAAILLLECLERYTGCQMFNNPNIQIQVCSPGRLTARNAALHAIAFYLSSDTLRQYKLEDFATTVSDDYCRRGKRIVIYDGHYGQFDSAFAWWARHNGVLAIRDILPFLDSRTDILAGPASQLDIQNVNLLATLLVHAQSSGDGYWTSLGEQFVKELVELLDYHLLAGLVDAPWVGIPQSDVNAANDCLFLAAVQELTAYAAAEAVRLKKTRGSPSWKTSSPDKTANCGILGEMQDLLATYRTIVTSISEPVERGAQ